MKTTIYFGSIEQFNAAFPERPTPEYQIGLHGISVDVETADMKGIFERVSKYENRYTVRSTTINTYYDDECI